MSSNVVSRFRFQFSNLHTECLTILELLKSVEEGSTVHIKLEDTAAACHRLLGAYRRCLESLRTHRAEGGYPADVVAKLENMDHYETIRLHQLELAWKRATEDYERARLLETSKERRKRRKTFNASNMLRDAKHRMQAELVRMEKIDAGLGEISGNIEKSGSLSAMYNTELRRARVFFKQVLVRAENDKRYLQRSWLFLCAVCTYIILKRLNLLRLGYLVTRLAFWLANVLVRVTLSIAQVFGVLEAAHHAE
eukprot:Gregarina_sp_Pseudo_9__1633@NODE_209_length_3610_cov_60_079530_g194_i0_p3_GENE_NODE_209_length_3610_cov_60_079530_g194_i0NODE_209_length_3610_cov_60_079530_g194_i0_p3_ORF_typecomplete_len252_score31_39Sec20/PF03908_13/4_4e08_NODE_209_length_3610_cov_60_079530_g194_i023503105